MPGLALVDVEAIELVLSHGVTARELLDLRPQSREFIGEAALAMWLLEEGLAEPKGEPGLLVPTTRAIDVAATFGSSSWSRRS